MIPDISDPLFVPPSNFSLGNPPVYKFINTTAVFDGDAALCLSYSQSTFPMGTEPRLFHFINDAWEDVTTDVDSESELLCGSVTSFSPFALGIASSIMAPTMQPTPAQTMAPAQDIPSTVQPTPAQDIPSIMQPTPAQTMAPTTQPTAAQDIPSTMQPTVSPTMSPTIQPTAATSSEDGTLPGRTHFFAAYAASLTFRSYTPVILADNDFSGHLAQDIVSEVHNAGPQPENYSVIEVYRSTRKDNNWLKLPDTKRDMFALEASQDGTIRLRLDMNKTPLYTNLRSGEDTRKARATFDSSQDALSSRGVERSEALSGTAQGGKFDDESSRALLARETTSSGATVLGEELTFETQNFAAADFIQDYAIIFQAPLGTPLRMDVTVVPLVTRDGEPSLSLGTAKSMVCLPGSAEQGLSNIDAGVPKRISAEAACPVFPMRADSQSRVLDSDSFDGLHPEEKEWVEQRMLKTGPKLADFMERNLFPMSVSTPSDLKVAITVSGGGKRSVFNGGGVLAGLAEAGVLDLATWISGASGGSWLLGGLYENSMQKNGLDIDSFFAERDMEMGKSLFDGTFSANDVLTNLGVNGWFIPTVKPFKTQPSAAATSASIMCQTELKFQSAAIKSLQTKTYAFAEYWGRAVAFQLLAQDGGLGTTMSGLLNHNLLADHNAPLPFMLIQTDQGEVPYFLEVSPFDVSVHKGDVHVSYPTALLGTDVSDASQNCTIQSDQLAWIMGLSSWLLPLSIQMSGGLLDTLLCGATGDICKPLAINNPFLGHTGQSQAADPQELFSAAETKVVDGGVTYNDPLWPFITPTRKADVAIVIDQGGAEGDPPLSMAPPATCAADGAGTCAVGSSSDEGLSNTCCNTCVSVPGFGCWPTSDMSQNNLLRFSSYSDEHTLPADILTANLEASTLTSKVSFFGCREPNVTAIVYIPNRVVSSAKGGFSALRGSMEPNDYFDLLGGTPLSASDIHDVVQNGKDQVSAPDFNRCVACLFAASLPENNRETFWDATSVCTDCIETYCQPLQ